MSDYILKLAKALLSANYTSIIAVFIITYLLWYINRVIKAKRTLPPGPFPYPVVGNSLAIGKVAHHSLAKMAKKYGDVMTVFIGPNPVVIVSGSKSIRECLLKKLLVCSGRPRNYLTKMVELPDGSIAITSADYGPYVKLHRKISHSAIRSYVTASKSGSYYEKFASDEALKLIHKFSVNEGKPFIPSIDIVTTLTDVTISLLCGQDKAEKYLNKSSFRNVLSLMRNTAKSVCINNILDTYTFIGDVLLSLSKIFSSDLNRIMHCITTMLIVELQNHKETFDKDNIRDIIDALLKAKEEAVLEDKTDKTELLNDSKLVSTLSDLFAAGIQTTSSTLEWFILYMITNPDVQEKIHQEIDEVVGRDRYPTMQDKEKLVYLQAAILETLRMSSIAPLILPHKAITDFELDGYRIPADTTVWFNVWTIHYDETLWPNANKFDPTRHITSEGTIQKVSPNLMPFSGGARTCIGEMLAKFNVYVFISHLMQHFEFKKVGNKELDTTPLGGIVAFCKQYQLKAIPRHVTPIKTG